MPPARFARLGFDSTREARWPVEGAAAQRLEKRELSKLNELAYAFVQSPSFDPPTARLNLLPEGTMPQHLEQARLFRERAARLRRILSDLPNLKHRTVIEQTADHYEQMAQSEEAKSAIAPKPSPP